MAFLAYPIKRKERDHVGEQQEGEVEAEVAEEQQQGEEEVVEEVKAQGALVMSRARYGG